jgi:hypothetical protein
MASMLRPESSMKMIGLLILMYVLVSFSAEADTRIFSPALGVKVIITVDGQILSWKVDYGSGENKERVDVDTEKSVYLDVNDYDFSGYPGFAVWHVDDGMGTYFIYRVFTFSPSTNKFIERSPATLCGDEFINLKIDKKGQRLFSTFWDQNTPRMCATRLHPIK